MEGTPDKPEGTEQNSPGRNPERQGPGDGDGDPGAGGPRQPDPGNEPPDEAAPGERGVTAPKRGTMGSPGDRPGNR